jgi:Fe-S cluster biogenesis protein NfuA
MNDELQGRIQHIERLIERVRELTDVEARTAALELLQAVLDFHAAGLDRMMEITSTAGDSGWAIIDGFGGDPLVSNMLLLHGLHPLDTDTRVRDALDKVRPYLRSHGGDVELIEVAGNTVRLRLTGSCHGCPSSVLTLKTAIETSIKEMAPEVRTVDCDAVGAMDDRPQPVGAVYDRPQRGDNNGTSTTVSVSGAA